MKKAPLVSVVMPVYNSEKFLDGTIRSVLSQSYRNFEFIIVDDCSTDGSLEIIRKRAKSEPRIMLVENKKNLGISESRNAGIGKAAGKYIMNMDHDDLSMKGRMMAQVEYLEKNPEVGIVGSDIEVIDKDGKVIGSRGFPEKDEAIRGQLLKASPFAHPSTMARREAYEKSGKYDRGFEPADDYELYYRIGKHFKFGNIRRPLFRHRIHGDATTMKRARRMVFNTLKAKWRGIARLGYAPDIAAIAIMLAQSALLVMPLFVLEKIVLSQYEIARR